MSLRSLLFLTAAAVLTATPVSAAVVTYSWTGGGDADSLHRHMKGGANGTEIEDYTYGVSGAGTFSFDTAAIPANSNAAPVYNYEFSGWLSATTHLDGPLDAGAPITGGAYASQIRFDMTDGSGYLFSDDTTSAGGLYAYNINQLMNLVVLETFTIDGVVLPLLFDLEGAFAQSTRFVMPLSGPYAYEQWLSRLSLASVRVFVDGVEYTGGHVVDTPEPAALALFGLGLAGLALTRRRRTA